MSIVEQIITFSFSNRILYITSEEYDILKQRERERKTKKCKRRRRN